MPFEKHILAAVAVSVICIAAPAAAAPANFDAAISSKNRATENIELDPGRQPAAVLKFLELETGDTALDFIAGAGYYSEIMAAAVGPTGTVIAFQPPRFANDEKVQAAWKALSASYPNARQHQQPNAPASIDFTVIHLVYHDLYLESTKVDPNAVLASLYKAMKPGGTVGVIDHVGSSGDPHATANKVHRIDPAVVRADFERAGFVFDGSSELLRSNADNPEKSAFDPAVRGKTDRFVYRFRKPEA